MYIVSTLHLKIEKQVVLNAQFPNDVIKHVDSLMDLSDEELEKIEILFTFGNHLSEDLLEKMKALRWIHSGQSGVDVLPQKLLLEKDVIVTNSRGINAVAIAEYVMGVILGIEKNLYQFYDAQKHSEWDFLTRQTEIAGKTMMILGTGNVGVEIAQRAKAFDLKVLGVNLHGYNQTGFDEVYLFSDLIKIINRADYLVLAMPLTELTYHAINEKVFEQMKTTAILLNVGRGAIIKTEDLIMALKENKIRMAVLDVFEEEPLEKDSELWKMKEVVITPHIAGDRIKDYTNRMLHILCENLSVYPKFEKMKNIVNLKDGY